MDWKKYESKIFEYFEKQYPDAQITLDAKKLGLYSKVSRQIDVLIEQYVAGNKILIVIDGKYLNKRVDVKAVESFIGMLEDIGAHKGLLISKEGFTKGAYNRAHFGPSEVELDILNFEDLHMFQSHGAMPYAGNHTALVPAPFGWIIDGNTTENWVCTLYQQGLTLDEAINQNEFMYINFWDRIKNKNSLNDLLKIQEDAFKNHDSGALIEYIPTITRKENRVILRKAKIKNYPTEEYTGFIEFSDFIFFCVMFSPENRSRKNIRKLENILESVKVGSIEHKRLKG